MLEIYTESEKTVKKYTVAQAVDAAKILLEGKAPINITAIPKSKEKITLKELNEISEKIVEDSLYYN